MKFVLLALCSVLAALVLVRGDSCCRCPQLWTFWNGHCYRFFNTPRLNFDEAEKYCNSFVAHLARVDNVNENEFLFIWWASMRAPSSNSTQHVRIGYVKDEEDQWKWSVGYRAIYYTNWDIGQPDNSGGNQGCAVIWRRGEYDTGAWDDEDCKQARAFFCEFTAPR